MLSAVPQEGVLTIRHNEFRDFTAKAMSEVCHNVQVEPPLQLLTGETLTYATANTEDGGRFDISVQGFWGNRYQREFFDVLVFNPNAPSYRNLQSASVYRRQERQKQRAYEQRVRNVEFGSFTRKYEQGNLCRVQEACINAIWKTRPAIQSRNGMAAVPFRILAATISHHLSSWGSIISWTCCTY